MDSQVYNELIALEETHWWFVSRRTISRFLLDGLKLPKTSKILDIGCGSGGNLPMLAEYGMVYGCEMNDKAREHSMKRNVAPVGYGCLPDQIPFAGTRFDLITMFDVLEHIEDDNAALKAVAARISQSGVLFLTVPAFQFIFSRHDRLHHHFRRYSKKELIEKVEAAGFKVEFINYWNFFLFPVAYVVRLLDFLFMEHIPAVGAKASSPATNNLLIKLVSSETRLIKKMRFPFGLSFIMVARKL